MTTEPPLPPESYDHIPTQGRLLGIDFGTVRVGLSLCDESQNWVTPLETYSRRNERLDQQYLLKLAQDEKVVAIVMGLPIHCDGKESQKSKQVREYAIWLEKGLGIPIALFDERFTTSEARRLLAEHPMSSKKKKEKLDGVAAQLILSHFLESRHNSPTGNDATSRGLDDE